MTNSQSLEHMRSFALLSSVVRELRHDYPRMELGQLQILLLILASPGIRMADLRSPTGVTRSAISRNVQALSGTSYLHESNGVRREGYGLVEVAEDPFDARSRILRPSVKGKELGRRMASLLQGDL
jgi:DNA-binding MarR family transcriptional regulator